MKKIEIMKNSKSYALGYEDCKKDMQEKMLKFVDEECEFILGIHADSLLDRLVKFIKKL